LENCGQGSNVYFYFLQESKENFRVYKVCLRIPAYWLLYNEMYLKYQMTDIEFVAPEINFGQVPQSLFDKERAAVWTAGIILYRFLLGVSPWTLEKAVLYGKSSGRDGLP
jgi:hypothetical protein